MCGASKTPIRSQWPVVKVELGDINVLGMKRPREEVSQAYDSIKKEIRSGKWTREEEIYSLALIRKFEAGELIDCADGRTLRSYLCQKLNSAPMRVTKKYAGQNIGKQIYTKVIETESPEEGRRLQMLAEESRKSFQRKVTCKSKRTRHTISPDSQNDGVMFKEVEEISLCESIDYSTLSLEDFVYSMDVTSQNFDTKCNSFEDDEEIDIQFGVDLSSLDFD